MKLWRNSTSAEDGWIWCLSCRVYHQPGDPHLNEKKEPKIKRIWCLSCRRYEISEEKHLNESS